MRLGFLIVFTAACLTFGPSAAVLAQVLASNSPIEHAVKRELGGKRPAYIEYGTVKKRRTLTIGVSYFVGDQDQATLMEFQGLYLALRRANMLAQVDDLRIVDNSPRRFLVITASTKSVGDYINGEVGTARFQALWN